MRWTRKRIQLSRASRRSALVLPMVIAGHRSRLSPMLEVRPIKTDE